jgi:hypothetical protein
MSCMTTTTHIIVVKLSHGGYFAHEVVVLRSNDYFLSSTSSKILHDIA